MNHLYFLRQNAALDSATLNKIHDSTREESEEALSTHIFSYHVKISHTQRKRYFFLSELQIELKSFILI